MSIALIVPAQLPALVAPGQLRHHCRNPRCGGKLQRPTNNRLDAFCCRGCFDSYYRSRCLVCEQPFRRKTERRQVCNRSKCRHEFQRHRERFRPPATPHRFWVTTAQEVPISRTSKSAKKSVDRFA
jgi:hypothetical protein